MEQLIMELCALDGVAGYEQKVVNFIAERICPYTEIQEIDASGNLYAFVKGKKPRKAPVLLCAHTDEVGYLVNKITDTGRLKLACVGAIDPRLAVGMRMRVGEKKIKGVISVKAYHLTTPEEREKAPQQHELTVDIGTSSKEETEKLVAIGDQVVFDYEPQMFGDNCIRAKALDDRVGCAILMKLIEQPLEYDTWFAFTSSEEIWLRGALPLTRRIDPSACLVIEGTSAADFPEMPMHKQGVRLREGVAVSVIDLATVYPRDFREQLLKKASEKGIKWQYRAMNVGGTDSGVLHCEASGAKVLGLSFPARYMHSSGLVASMDDINEVFSLSRLFVEEVENLL